MSKRTRILAAVMATMTITTALMGCGSSSSSSSTSKDKQTLTIWSHLSTAEVDEVRKLAETWGNENNCTVTVQEDKGKVQDAITALSSSKGPDAYFGLPNDNLGTYQKAGVLAEVPSGTIDASKMTAQNVVDAVTIGGKQYAVPLAQECIGLFYNKKLVTEAPKTMEEAITTGKDKGFVFDATNFYLDYAFISAGGGYVFKDNNGTLDANDIGLGNEGATKGYKMLKSFVDNKLFAPDVTDDIAKGQFTAGSKAFYISGPWAIADCEKAGMDIGIAPLPTIDGKTAKPFLGVQAAIVNAKSDKQDLAWKLTNYLAEKSPDMLLEKGNRLPVLKSALESSAFKANKYMSSFADAAKVAVPMPNIVEVQNMWDPAKNNIVSMLGGAQTPEDTASKIVDQMKEKAKQ